MKLGNNWKRETAAGSVQNYSVDKRIRGRVENMARISEKNESKEEKGERERESHRWKHRKEKWNEKERNKKVRAESQRRNRK
jgi:hypothetical protein